MATGKQHGAVLRQLRTLFNVGTIRELTDGQLLERFASDPGEAAELAFAALVERHGPMVLRVCRGVLGDGPDAEDAFQATFLVLVGKARALWVRDSLGPWLHQVAYRTASCARANASRRRRHERLAAAPAGAHRPGVGDELARALHEEVDRLPGRYRAAVVLCDLEGRTHEQAARHLGWPIGTVKSRLTRGRDRLRDRLSRRGLAPGSGLALAASGFEASISPALVDSAAGAASRFLAGRAFAGGFAASLAHEVIRSMSIIQWSRSSAVVLAFGATVSGVGLLGERGAAGVEAGPGGDLQSARADDVPVAAVEPGKLDLTVVVRGFVEASRYRDVASEVEGVARIIKILPEGSWVAAGDVVCELESAPLRDTLTNQNITTQQAQASYQQALLTREVAEYAVKEYLEGIFKQDLETKKGDVGRARSDLERANDRLKWSKSMREKGFVSRATNIADELAVERAKFDLEQAQTQLEVLEKYTKAKQIKSLNSDVEKARAGELSKQSTWELERAKVAKLERQLRACVLKAPGDGMVVYANEPPGNGGARFMIEEGDNVRERQLIFRLPDLNVPMRVHAKVPEASIARVGPGLRARIKLEASGGKTLAGVVTSVAPSPDPLGRFEPDAAKVYSAFIKIEDGPPGLRPGIPARVELRVGGLDEVLSVPAGAVLRQGGKGFLVVKKPGGGLELREVTLGLVDGRRVEVRRGLRRGETVVLDPADAAGERPEPAARAEPPR